MASTDDKFTPLGDYTQGSAPTMAPDRQFRGAGAMPTLGDARPFDEQPTIIAPGPVPHPDRPAPSSPIGRIDQYELIRKLGGGGFGVVYLARDTYGIEYALKTLHPMLKSDAEEMERLREKFALVARLSHPNIALSLVLHPAQKIDIFDDTARRELRLSPGDSVMVMRYAPGVTLSRWRRQFRDGIVPLETALEIGRQVAAALDYAHGEKIVHRDIKPANVMVETIGVSTTEKTENTEVGATGSVHSVPSVVPKLRVRILDFGLAAEIRSSMSRISTETGDTSGTRPYMAPEQWQGKKQDGRTDQYALACVLYELLSGEPPFAGVFETGDPVAMRMAVEHDVPEYIENIPPAVNTALLKALSKRREDRFGTCGEFIGALGRANHPDEMHIGLSIPQSLSGILASLQSVRLPRGKGWLAAIAALLIAVLPWFAFRSCGGKLPTVANITEADILNVIPNNPDAAVKELQDSIAALKRIGRENQSWRFRCEQEIVVLETRITERCRDKISAIASDAGKSIQSLSEFARWDAREKLVWQKDSQKTPNKFTENFEAAKNAQSRIERAANTPEDLEAAYAAWSELRRAADWIKSNARERESLAKSEAAFNQALRKLEEMTVKADMPSDELAKAKAKMEASKALRDKGDFGKAAVACAEAVGLLGDAGRKAQENKERRSYGERIAQLLKEAESVEKDASAYAWRDNGYAARRETIGKAKDAIAKSGRDKTAVASAGKRLEEAKAALQWMKDNSDARREAENAANAVAALMTAIDESAAAQFAAKAVQKAASVRDEAGRLVDSGEYSKAVSKYRDSLKLYKGAMADAWMERAKRLFRERRRADCAAAAAKALEFRPGDKEAQGFLDNLAADRAKFRRELDEAEARIQALRKQIIDMGADFLPETEFGVASGAYNSVDALWNAERYEEAVAKAGEAERLYGVALDAAELARLRARASDALGAMVAPFAKYADPAYAAHFRAFAAATNDVLHAKSLDSAREADKRATEAKDWILGNAKVRGEASDAQEKAENLFGLMQSADTDARSRNPEVARAGDAARDEGARHLAKGDYTGATERFGEAYRLYGEAIGEMRKDKAKSFLALAIGDFLAGRWENCARNIAECLKWDTENREALVIKRNVTRILSPKNGDHHSIMLADRRDLSGGNEIPLTFVFQGNRWIMETPVSRGQWLAIDDPYHAFIPKQDDDAKPANNINLEDARRWIDALRKRPECAGWTFSAEFSEGSEFSTKALNRRGVNSRFRLTAKPIK
jgi:serine/threonine-protein kinase